MLWIELFVASAPPLIPLLLLLLASTVAIEEPLLSVLVEVDDDCIVVDEIVVELLSIGFPNSAINATVLVTPNCALGVLLIMVELDGDDELGGAGE
jgi:hypothetical protein